MATLSLLLPIVALTGCSGGDQGSNAGIDKGDIVHPPTAKKGAGGGG